MNKIQKYSLRLDEYHTLHIREEGYMHRRPCDIITYRYNKIVVLYNKDQDFTKSFLINTKFKLAYIIYGSIEIVSDLLEKEVMRVSEAIMAHEHERGDNEELKLRKIYTEALIGEAIQREHAQMIIDKI